MTLKRKWLTPTLTPSRPLIHQRQRILFSSHVFQSLIVIEVCQIQVQQMVWAGKSFGGLLRSVPSWGGSGIIQFRMPASWFSIFFTATHWCSSVKQVSHCEHILASCCRCGHLSWKASSKVRSNVLTNRWFSGYVQWFQLQSSITQQEQGLVTIPRCLGGWVQTERFVEDDMLVLDVGNLHRYIYIHIYIYTYL